MSGKKDIPRIDRARVRAEARKLNGSDLRIWIDRAIEFLPEERLPQLVKDYVKLEALTADEHTEEGFLNDVQKFYEDALAGKYYHEFFVGSRNFQSLSMRTENFIAEFERLIDACMAAEGRDDLSSANGLRLLVELAREIDRCEREIVFLSDEGGSWQLGINWSRVLPTWFRCLASQLDADLWAETVVKALRDLGRGHTEDILRQTRADASVERNKALDEWEASSIGVRR